MTQDIPVNHHVVRTVGKDSCDVALDGRTVTVESSVFLPRKDHPPGTGLEPYVSVDWFEYFSGTLRDQLDQVREAVVERMPSGRLGQHARLATVLVNDVHDSAAKDNIIIDVCTTGDADDPSHSGIYGLDPSDHIIAQEIARRAEAYPAYS